MVKQDNNANARMPSQYLVAPWVFALVVACITIAGLEYTWRAHGYTPTLIDDDALWCQIRDRVKHADSDTLVLIGHSRIHEGFIADEFEKVTPNSKVLQLAVFNSSPIASLQDIANNSDFSGTVICSVLAHCLLPEAWEPTHSDPKSRVLSYYRNNWNWFTKVDRMVRSAVQSNLTVVHPDLSLQYILPDIVKSEWPVQWVHTDANRMQTVDYTKSDVGLHEAKRIAEIKKTIVARTNISGYKHWPQPDKLAQLEASVKTIQDRGGRVVFFRAVTSGEYGQLLDGSFPREKFWDVFAKSTSATTIHFADVPVLANMRCAEGSHLTPTDARIFTRWMASELKQRGLIRSDYIAAGR